MKEIVIDRNDLSISIVNGEIVKFQRNAQTQIVSRRIRIVARF